MGTDKALLPLVDGGPAMLALVLERLRTVADDVMVVANDHQRYEPFGARVVPDLHADIGALGGIHAAISNAVHDYCLVVACDMPFLDGRLLRRMASESRDFDVLVPVVPGDSRQGRTGSVRQTLHAIYNKQCLPAIESRIIAGDRKVIGFFGEVRVREIGLAEILSLDPELRSFFNANTPGAMHLARTLAEGREPFGAPSRSHGERGAMGGVSWEQGV